MLTLTVTLIEAILVRNGRDIGITMAFVGPLRLSLGYSRRDIDTDWLVTFMSTVGMRTMAGQHVCRVRLVDGAITEIGHPREDRWLDPRSDDQHQPGASELARRRVEQALSHVNRKRSRFGRRDLDPAASGWTDDDVIAEAQRLGWDG